MLIIVSIVVSSPSILSLRAPPPAAAHQTGSAATSHGLQVQDDQALQKTGLDQIEVLEFRRQSCTSHLLL